MLDKYIQPTQPQRAEMQTKKLKVTQELVMAISDRVYAMLLRELKVERERQRVWNRSQRK